MHLYKIYFNTLVLLEYDNRNKNRRIKILYRLVRWKKTKNRFRNISIKYTKNLKNRHR